MGSTSKLASQVQDQYFTPVETAKWCFEKVAKATGWSFEGTALEPAVGAFAFVEAASQLGLKLEWTTNDLFPQPGKTPDLTLDYVTEKFDSYDYVITNPPFGHANSLARQFLKKSLSLSDHVLMIFPKGARRVGFQDSMPRTARRVFDSSIEMDVYQIPGHGERKVKTCIQAWSNSETPQPTIKSQMDLRTDLISSWCASQEDTFLVHPKMGKAKAQICRWGYMGITRPEIKKSGSWESVAFNSPQVDYDTFESICRGLDFSEYKDMCSGAPAFDVPVFLHRFNTEAVSRGMLPPNTTEKAK